MFQDTVTLKVVATSRPWLRSEHLRTSYDRPAFWSLFQSHTGLNENRNHPWHCIVQLHRITSWAILRSNNSQNCYIRERCLPFTFKTHTYILSQTFQFVVLMYYDYVLNSYKKSWIINKCKNRFLSVKSSQLHRK